MLLSSNTSGELQTARDTALKDRNYDSERTRRAMDQKLQDDFDGRSPYNWQLDAAEALILGLDCVVVAGTGAGKSEGRGIFQPRPAPAATVAGGCGSGA